MSTPSNMTLAGIDGELELYASPDKKTGVIRDVVSGKTSTPKPLQVLFKWGNFVSPTTVAVRAKGAARVSIGST